VGVIQVPIEKAQATNTVVGKEANEKVKNKTPPRTIHKIGSSASIENRRATKNEMRRVERRPPDNAYKRFTRFPYYG